MLRPLLKANWPAPSHIHAYTTFKSHPYGVADFSLSPFVGDMEQTTRNNKIVTQTLGLKTPLTFLKQVHGAEVVQAPYEQGTEADGCFTSRTHQVCAVLTADCLPIIMTDKDGTVVCALHGGWRGLAAQIIAKGISQIKKTSDKPILAWLGPAIGPEVFQVGPEVRDAFVNQNPLHQSAFKEDMSKPGYYLADIYMLAKQQLKELGVVDVFGGEYCTVTHEDMFFSYRRGDQCGRMATLIWMDSIRATSDHP